MTTGTNLLAGFSHFINDFWESTTTSAGAADGTTLIDTTLRRWQDDGVRSFWFRPTSGSATLEIRRASSFANSNGAVTVQPAFSAQIASSVTYGMHRYDPAQKFRALDDARFRVYPNLAIVRYNDTITTFGRQTDFAIPSTVKKGPLAIMVEEPLEVAPTWNFLTTPRLDATTGWTASNTTASTYSQEDPDLLVPKYDAICTRLATAASTVGTYTQTIGNMTNDITAAKAAGREMVFGMWVYCKVASRVSLSILDDSGTVTAVANGGSSTHSGNGWEFLSVSGVPVHTNATTLSVRLTVSSGTALTIFCNRAWFAYGSVLPNIFHDHLAKRVRRDDTTSRFYLDFVPPARRNLRLVGLDVLSALGSTAATQITNTMEVDDATEQLLYAHAAEILFEWEGITSSEQQEVFNRIGVAKERMSELKPRWSYFSGVKGKNLRGPWT